MITIPLSTLKAGWLLKYWSVRTLVSSGQSSSIKYIRKLRITHVTSANFVMFFELMLNPSIHTPAGKVLEQNHNAVMFEKTLILQKEI